MTLYMPWVWTLVLFFIGTSTKSSEAILNCILARKLCIDDAICAGILEIVPRVCGSATVACSTVTVNKCQAALVTLQAFHYYQPTCLCREPHLDRKCNSFRDFLFDHPCMFISKKDISEPYHVDALPTCDYAHDVCKRNKHCIEDYETFKSACRFKDGICTMRDRLECERAWLPMRLSPMFACICPSSIPKGKCDRIYQQVNNNPCIDTNSWEKVMQYPRVDSVETQIPTSIEIHTKKFPTNKMNEFFQPQSDLYLQNDLHDQPQADSPARSQSRSMFPSHFYDDNEDTSELSSLSRAYSELDVTETFLPELPYIRSSDRSKGRSKPKQEEDPSQKSSPWKRLGSIPIENIDGWRDKTLRIPHYGQQNKMPFTSLEPNNPGSFYVPIVCKLAVPGQNDKDTSFTDESKSGNKKGGWRGVDVKTPLLGKKPSSNRDLNDLLYEVNGIQENSSSTHSDNRKAGKGRDTTPHAANFRNTCHTVLNDCMQDVGCRNLLRPVLQVCEPHRCNMEGCMEKLRNFYRNGKLRWSLEVAFCTCSDSSDPNDDCIGAQDKLHPICAWKSSTGSLPLCHKQAHDCKEDKECSQRLTFYEQACAVDGSSLRCAGSQSECRRALIGTLGTSLRLNCTCPDEDSPDFGECKDWYQLLWRNPCVGYCTVTRSKNPDVYIAEGTGKRLYSDERPECSDVCNCHMGEQLVCNEVCIPRVQCNSTLASYSHGAPAFQAFRGECICYSGQFVCMRPRPNTYLLPEGLFLFLGFSSRDEESLRSRTKKTIIDSITRLDALIKPTNLSQPSCHLKNYDKIGENLILQASMDGDRKPAENESMALSILYQEKEECTPHLMRIMDLINKKDPIIISDTVLSMIKLADVEVTIPDLESAGALNSPSPLILLLSVVSSICYACIPHWTLSAFKPCSLLTPKRQLDVS